MTEINAAPKALSEKLRKQLKDELFMFLSSSLVKVDFELDLLNVKMTFLR